MLSICIPVYNFDVRPLVKELSRQMALLTVPSELILIDDASTQFIEENKKIRNNHRCIQLSENIGRARIRNLFLEYVRFGYLLFLDCDSLVVTDDFLERYIDILTTNSPEVTCGGRIYSTTWPGRKKNLSWQYGKKRESKTAEERKRTPNKSFMTNNFVVKRAVLEQIKFDERLSEYGHEDTLFGFELLLNNIYITHIENPILNGDIEDNDVFLEKTEKGVCNLSRIANTINEKEMFIDTVMMLKIYYRFRFLHIEILIDFIFRLSKERLRTVLTSGYAPLLLFDFYKFGLLNDLENMRYE